MPIVLGCVGGFLFLILFGVVGAALLGGEDDDSAGGGASTSYTTAPVETTSAAPSISDPSTEPPTSSASGTGTDGDLPYGTPEENDVYATGAMAGVGCTAQLPSTNPGPLREYIEEAIPCLNQAWRTQLTKQGIEYQEPGVVISEGENPETPCRSADVGYTPTAFYCPTNQTLYFNLPATKGAQPDFAVRTTPHEYGHHVQNLVGIAQVQAQRQYEADPDVAETTAISRRTELQAQCFAALFLGGNADTMGTSQAAVQEHTGGDDYVEGVEDDPSLRTHGNLTSNRHWLGQGWPTDASACNTWSAPEHQVE